METLRTPLTRVLAALIAAVLMLGGAQAALAETLTATPANVSGATLDVTLPNGSSPTSVSPEVYYDSDTGTYYLYTTSMPPKVYRSANGTDWTEVSGAALPNGFDWSIVKLGPNNYRMYYAAINPNLPGTMNCQQQRKELRYATSTDLVTWTTQPGVLMDNIGCGVPVVIRKADGSYLLYWNTINTGHGVHIATSPDGLSWTTVAGPVNGDQNLVDPAPVLMPDGTYLMVASDSGGPNTAQYLKILTSPDGVTWTQRSTPLFKPAGYNAFDPVLKLVDGKLRVWFAYTPLSDMQRQQSRVASAVLTLGAGTVAAPSSTKARVGAACPKVGTKSGGLKCVKVKGKLVWKK